MRLNYAYARTKGNGGRILVHNVIAKLANDVGLGVGVVWSSVKEDLPALVEKLAELPAPQR